VLEEVTLPKATFVHAYLIFAHKNLDQLPRLIDRLDTGAASFFLHIDRKTDTTSYQGELGKLASLPNVHFVPRHHCPWAAFKGIGTKATTCTSPASGG
jgi:hypothetical protein